MTKKFKVIVVPGSLLQSIQAVENTLQTHLPADFRWQRTSTIGWDARKDGYEIYRIADGRFIAKIDGFGGLNDMHVRALDALEAMKAFGEYLAEALQMDVKITTE